MKIDDSLVKRMGPIEIVCDESNGPRKYSFNGVWIVKDIRPHADWDPEGTEYSVALTANKQILVYKETPKNGADYAIINGFKNLKEYPCIPGEVKHAVAEEIGEDHTEFMDI